MDAVTLYVTWPDMGSAQAAGRLLIEQGLAACVTILPGAVSLYRWEGALHTDQEVVMLAKTRRPKADAARDAILSAHPYDTPCVLGFEADPALSSPAYLAWLAAETPQT